jgi:hypothetical protein
VFLVRYELNLYMLCRSKMTASVVSVPGYRSRGPVSIPDAPDFLRISGSGTGSTLPREYK